jgi:hypothetical protein
MDIDPQKGWSFQAAGGDKFNWRLVSSMSTLALRAAGRAGRRMQGTTPLL